MTETVSASRRVVLQFSAHSVDVLVPDHVSVADALRSVGVDPSDPALVVVTSDGTRLDLAAAAGVVLHDGAVVHVSAASSGVVTRTEDRTAPEVVSSPVAAAGAPTVRAPAPQVLLVALAGACALAVVTMSTVPGLVQTGAVSGTGQQVVAGTFLLAALLLGLSPAVRHDGGTETSLVVAALLACAGGATTVDTTLASSDQLAVVAGFVGASVVSALAAVRARASRARDDGVQVAVVLATSCAGVAGVAGAALTLGLPAWTAAAVLLGLVPLLLRLLPSCALRVPVVFLVDAAHVTRSALSVRGAAPAPPPAVRSPVVERAVGRGDRLLAAGTVALSVMAAATTPFVLLGTPPGGAEGVTAVVLVLLVAVALTSVPRTARAPSSRTAPRAAAAAMLLAIVLRTAFVGGPTSALPLACGLAALGMLVVFAAGAIRRGRRSVGLSRLTDSLEGLVVALSLPAALVTIGVVEMVRSAVSG